MNEKLINPLWNYSLKLYADTKIKQLCHILQENHHANINIILWCCWYAAADYGQINEELLKKVISESSLWQDNVTCPFRKTRNWLKKQQINELVPDYNQQIIQLELISEALQQAKLYELSINQPQRGQNKLNDSRINLQIYFNTLQNQVDTTMWEQIEMHLLPQIASNPELNESM